MSNRSAPSLTSHLCFLLILLAAVWVRLRSAADFPLNPDELTVLKIASAGSLKELWQLSLNETHPPLDYLFRHAVLQFNSDPAFQRYATILPGLVPVFYFYRTGRLCNPTCGLAMAVAAAFWKDAVILSTAVRSYALFMAFFSASAYYYLYACLTDRRPGWAFALMLTLACASHISGIVAATIFGLHQAYQLIRARGNFDAWLKTGILFIPTSLTVIFLYLFFFAPGTNGPGWHEFYKTHGIAFAFGRNLVIDAANFMLLFEYLHTDPNRGVLRLLIVIAGIVLYGFSIINVRRHTPKLFALLACFWIVACAFTVTDIYSLNPSRHNYYSMLFLSLPLAFLAGQHLPQRWLPMAVAACCMFGIWRHWEPRLEMERPLNSAQWREAQAYLREHVKPGDRLVMNKFSMLYFLPPNISYVSDTPTLRFSSQGYDIATERRLYYWVFVPDHLRQLVKENDGERIWFVTIAWTDAVLGELYRCLKLHHAVEQETIRDGFFAYSTSRVALQRWLLDSGAPCLEPWKRSIVPLWIEAKKYP